MLILKNNCIWSTIIILVYIESISLNADTRTLKLQIGELESLSDVLVHSLQPNDIMETLISLMDKEKESLNLSRAGKKFAWICVLRSIARRDSARPCVSLHMGTILPALSKVIIFCY